MKFEDLYTKANDNIHADRKIIDSIYDKASHKAYFNYKPAILCAASIALVISLSLVPKFYEGENIKNSKVLYKSSVQKDNKTTIKEDIHKSVPDTANKKTAMEDAAVENSDVFTPISELTPQTASEEATSGGGSMLKSRSIEINIEEMPYDEYTKYLGWDILECNLSVPDGMVISVPDTVTIVSDKATGNVTEDTVQYVFYNTDSPNEFLSVSASIVDKNAENIYNSNEKTFIGEKEFVIIQNDITKEAYAKQGNVWLHIMSIDVTGDEFVAFLQSLIQ